MLVAGAQCPGHENKISSAVFAGLCKSMTTFADHRVWQDIYHAPARGMMLYLKFQADVVTEFTIMSFKKR